MADNINREHFLITYEVEGYQQALQQLQTMYEAGKKLEGVLGGNKGKASKNTKEDYENAISIAWANQDKNLAQKLYNQALSEGISWAI